MASIAKAGVRNAERLAQMANEDTGFGKVADKVIKNIFGSQMVYEAYQRYEDHWYSGPR